jgi:DNA (cytosine-5)-methyltransferase 1
LSPFSARHYLQDKKKGFEDEKAGFAVPEYFRVIKEVNRNFHI